MKTTTSFWKRCLAWAMALVLLVSGSNLGVALQAFATEDGGASLTAGEIVAAHYDLPEGQKALLKSCLLYTSCLTVILRRRSAAPLHP